MEQKKTPVFDFLSEDEKGTKKILQSQLIDFLEKQGYNNSILEGQQELICRSNQILRRTSTQEVIDFVRTTLESNELREYYDVFAENPTRYISRSKLQLLKKVDLVNDRDHRDSSRFYFQNCYCEVTMEGFIVHSYENLEGTIWENRIINKEFNMPANNIIGQFHQWCINITGKDPIRFKALQSFLGYLLHRNKERGENKAIILYDERMGEGGKANGRIGKTVLGKALSECRDVVMNDGKTKNYKSDFANELVTMTTDCVYYDDLRKDTKFDSFYSFITTGVEVNKKNKSIFRIDEWRSPKLIISSNYYVLGDGGDSDRARRYEFEISNYYNKNFTPEMDFEGRFWDSRWPQEEWNKFYVFMMECAQLYLSNGLIEAEPINLNIKKIEDPTCPEFREFGEAYFEVNKEMNKRELEDAFKELNPKWENLSAHLFYKWCIIYGNEKGLEFKVNPSGGKYLCIFTPKVKDYAKN